MLPILKNAVIAIIIIISRLNTGTITDEKMKTCEGISIYTCGFVYSRENHAMLITIVHFGR
jgi:hypothetical protein